MKEARPGRRHRLSAKTLWTRHHPGASEWRQWQSIVIDDRGPIPQHVLKARTAFFSRIGF